MWQKAGSTYVINLFDIFNTFSQLVEICKLLQF